MAWFRNEHDEPNGTGVPPVTCGEAKTMAAIVAGVDTEEIEAFVILSMLICPNCGLAHNMVSTNNVDDITLIHMLSSAIGDAHRRLYYG